MRGWGPGSGPGVTGTPEAPWSHGAHTAGGHRDSEPSEPVPNRPRTPRPGRGLVPAGTSVTSAPQPPGRTPRCPGQADVSGPMAPSAGLWGGGDCNTRTPGNGRPAPAPGPLHAACGAGRAVQPGASCPPPPTRPPEQLYRPPFPPPRLCARGSFSPAVFSLASGVRTDLVRRHLRASRSHHPNTSSAAPHPAGLLERSLHGPSHPTTAGVCS